MGKIPYLFRRKNVFYFRLIVPKELRTILNFPQITVGLKTQDSNVAIPAALMLASNLKSYLHDVKHGKSIPVERSVLVARRSKTINTQSASSPAGDAWEPLSQHRLKPSSPLLSVVIKEFLSRYNPKNRATRIFQCI